MSWEEDKFCAGPLLRSMDKTPLCAERDSYPLSKRLAWLVPGSRTARFGTGFKPALKHKGNIMWKHLALVSGLLMSICFTLEAQTPPTQTILAHAAPSLNMLLFRTARARLPLIVLAIPAPAKALPRPAFRLAAEFRPTPTLANRLQIEEVRTPFMTESTLPIAQLCPGLQLDGFDSTLHYRTQQLGWSASGRFQDLRPSSHDQAGLANSAELEGIALRYGFGRDAETRKPAHIWQCLLWVAGHGRGCPL
jgi:hypothetical protein